MIGKMKNDGYDHLREQVKKLCDIAMVKVWPGWDGIHPVGQAHCIAWKIIPEPWSYHSEETLMDIPGFEIPSAIFAFLNKELEMNKTPEQITELVEVRFKVAVLDL